MESAHDTEVGSGLSADASKSAFVLADPMALRNELGRLGVDCCDVCCWVRGGNSGGEDAEDDDVSDEP